MRKPTDWNEYKSNPQSFLSRHFFLNHVVKSYNRLLEGVRFEGQIKILEFGCGTGFTNLFLAKKFDVQKITAIDFNKKMLDISRQTLAGLACEKELIQEDFFMAEPKGQYDLVHSQGVIEHFEEGERLELLKKHFDLTKKGGYCIIYSPTATRPYRFFRKAAEIFGKWKFHDEVPLEKDLIIRECESIGFKAVKADFFWKYFLTEVGILFRK